MGIQGLLKVFSSIQKDHHLSDYSNQRVAIDTYCWIHKAIYLKAQEMMIKSDLSVYIPYVLSQIEFLLMYQIKPVMIFDGGKLISKSEEENSREISRQAKFAKAKELLHSGDHEAAYRKFAESVDVTPDLAYLLLKVIKCKYKDVICIVSPYEADAQLAYLSRIGFVDAIITEDSDLLCFGAKKMLYKLNNKGYVKEIKLCDWKECQEYDFKDWDFELFLSLCILSGCDYLDSLKNIGFKTAYKLLKDSRSVESLFRKWRIGSRAEFSADYEEKFYKAYLTFKFQRVFCPITRKMVNVNELNINKLEECLKQQKNVNSLGKIMSNPENLSPLMLKKLKEFYEKDESLEFLGNFISDSIVCDIADGNINPISLKPYNPRSTLKFEDHDNFFANSKELNSANLKNQSISLKNPFVSLQWKTTIIKPENENQFEEKVKQINNFNAEENNIFEKSSFHFRNSNSINPQSNLELKSQKSFGSQDKGNHFVSSFQKKAYQTNILSYMHKKDSKPGFNNNNNHESDFSLHSKPKKTIQNLQNKNTVVHLTTPEEIDKNRFKEIFNKNCVKRNYIEDENIEPPKKKVSTGIVFDREKPIWEKVEKITNPPLNISTILEEYKVKTGNLNFENKEENVFAANPKFLSICTNLFKPLF